MIEDGIIKWVWGSLGLMICSIPVFFNLRSESVGDLVASVASKGSDIDMGGRTQGFVTNVSATCFLSKTFFLASQRKDVTNPHILDFFLRVGSVP